MLEYEKEVKDKFNISMKIKDLSPEAKNVAEQYFLSRLKFRFKLKCFKAEFYNLVF